VGFLSMDNDGSCHGFLPRSVLAPPIFLSLFPTQNGRKPFFLTSELKDP
jgi:hypothetical protein